MEFSVVMPLFNKAPHVERAIVSVLEQSHAARELIVIDDGSTDGGAELVERMHGVRLLTRSPPGPGGYAARNVGVEQATGAWIAFLDADDVWYPAHLENLSTAIEASEHDIGCAFARPEMIKDGAAVEYPISPRLMAAAGEVDLATFLQAWLDTRICPMWTGAVAIRRSLLMRDRFPETGARRGGDKDLWLRIMSKTTGVFSPSVTAQFHQDTVNRVSNTTDHAVLPAITRSIASIIASAAPEERKLLRRLSNLEISLYARHAAGEGIPVGSQFYRSLYFPEGGGALTKMGMYAVASLLMSKSRKPMLAKQDVAKSSHSER